jgi:hypothetical protein
LPAPWGAARSGDPASAEREVEQLARLRDALKADKNAYWATEVEISRLAAVAWTALASGKKEEAVKLMRTAADMEDKNEKHIVTRVASFPRVNSWAKYCSSSSVPPRR